MYYSFVPNRWPSLPFEWSTRKRKANVVGNFSILNVVSLFDVQRLHALAPKTPSRRRGRKRKASLPTTAIIPKILINSMIFPLLITSHSCFFAFTNTVISGVDSDTAPRLLRKDDDSRFSQPIKLFRQQLANLSLEESDSTSDGDVSEAHQGGAKNRSQLLLGKIKMLESLSSAISVELLKDRSLRLLDERLANDDMKRDGVRHLKRFPRQYRPVEQIAERDSLQAFYAQLETLRPCNRTIETPLVHRLLSDLTAELHANLSTFFELSRMPGHLMPINALMRNGTATNSPAAYPNDQTTPAYALKLLCKPKPRWAAIVVYPTMLPNSFLQVQISEYPKLNACSLSACATKCSYTVHNQLKVFARSCCDDTLESSTLIGGQPTDGGRRFCREDLRLFKRIFYSISALLAIVIRERRREEVRGWALMEPFFLGAAFLYLIPLLDWYNADAGSCCVAVWLRTIGFTLFYGSILLKIFRNLQEYRVRKAHHVVVREQDLLKYLLVGLAVAFLTLFVWTMSSYENEELWSSSWPQCPVDRTIVMWAVGEFVTLFYAAYLCLKARNSSWVERYQFTLAILLEMFVMLVVNIIRCLLTNAGSNDALFIVAIAQLHFTVTANIFAIIMPKFLVGAESNRRTLTMSGVGNSGRAHPSLAKLRDNLVNGTIDFADVPVTDMNPEDIRAELKRVYTQLRMYKLKNAYQDNPHISKRKGGGAKKALVDKAVSKNRRISIPPTVTNSPKLRRVDEMMMAAADDEKSDLTVESAPHNIYFSTTNKMIQLQPNDQSVRV